MATHHTPGAAPGLDVSQTRVSTVYPVLSFIWMTLVKPRKHESTKRWFDRLTRGACPELVQGCLRVFVFTWLIAGGVMAAHAQVRVEHPEGGEVNPFDAPPGIKAIVFLFTSTECPI